MVIPQLNVCVLTESSIKEIMQFLMVKIFLFEKFGEWTIPGSEAKSGAALGLVRTRLASTLLVIIGNSLQYKVHVCVARTKE